MADLVQQYRELVASQPGDHVPTADAPLKPLGHGNQELVPDEMSQAVIDGFEAVQVDEQRPEQSIAGASGLRECVSQHLHEERSIWQPGQRIVQSSFAKLLLGAMPVGDIRER